MPMVYQIKYEDDYNMTHLGFVTQKDLAYFKKNYDVTEVKPANFIPVDFKEKF